MGKRLFVGNALARTLNPWAVHDELLAAFERLPVCFCHHDAFRRNMLARKGSAETVAIDWAITGFGRVGEEVGVTTAASIIFMAISSRQARALDQAVFAGYVEGLREAGWQGDVRLARLGYATNAFLLAGLNGMFGLVEILQTAEGCRWVEAMMATPLDQVLDQWLEVQPSLLDLGEEAYWLAKELS